MKKELILLFIYFTIFSSAVSFGKEIVIPEGLEVFEESQQNKWLADAIKHHNGDDYVRPILFINGEEAILKFVWNDSEMVMTFNPHLVTKTIYKNNFTANAFKNSKENGKESISYKFDKSEGIMTFRKSGKKMGTHFSTTPDFIKFLKTNGIKVNISEKFIEVKEPVWVPTY
ncbi:MAG: hypothetical protein K2H46_05905 [Muribaculaceae bacterium]|nr:hypothetical protein [Muribaculaceae bacterium]